MKQKKPRHISVILNDSCPLKCKHCAVGYSDGYSGTGAKVDESKLRQSILDIDTGIYDIVVFVGGEPTIAPNLLRIGIETCREVGLMSAITTAPIWAKTEEKARRFLEKLPKVDIVILSYDVHHLEFLSVEDYENATAAAVDRGTDVILHLCYSRPDEKMGLLSKVAHFLHQVSDIKCQLVVPVGNAAVPDNVQMTGTRIETVADIDRVSRSCEIGDASIGLQSDIHACCWSSAVTDSPLRFDRNREYGVATALAKLEVDPTFLAIQKKGMIDSLSTPAKEALLKSIKGQVFVNECHLCVQLLSPKNRQLWNTHITKQPSSAV